MKTSDILTVEWQIQTYTWQNSIVLKYTHGWVQAKLETCEEDEWIASMFISCWSEVLGYLVMSDCDPVDCSPPGSSVLGILQAGILEWIAIPVSRGSSQLRDRTQVSCIVGRFFTVWTTEKSLFPIKLFLKFFPLQKFSFLLQKAILDWFQILAITNKGAMNICLQILHNLNFHFPWINAQ